MTNSAADIWTRFVTDGYIVMQPELPAELHTNVLDQFRHHVVPDTNPGNNILPLVPDLRTVIGHPQVKQALAAILGQRFQLHPHRYCHLNTAGTTAQRIHQDSYCSDQPAHHHRPRWALLFYYPQDVTVDMGPTGVVPGSQYSLTLEADDSLPLTGAAGTVVIAHYDVWHHARANSSERDRYMMKFLFWRRDEPAAGGDPGTVAGAGGAAEAEDPAAAVSRWHGGAVADAAVGGAVSGNDDAGTVAELAAQLREGSDRQRITAALRLAALGPRGLEAAAAAMVEEAMQAPLTSPAEAASDDYKNNPADGYARHALIAAGARATGLLAELLADQRGAVRAAAADALGDAGQVSLPAVTALAEQPGDREPWVRRCTAEALGIVAGSANGEGAAVRAALSAALDDAEVSVRLNAMQSLAKLGADAGTDGSAVVRRLDDADRYVRYFAGAALLEAQDPTQRAAAVEMLATSRWCPLSTPSDPF